MMDEDRYSHSDEFVKIFHGKTVCSDPRPDADGERSKSLNLYHFRQHKFHVIRGWASEREEWDVKHWKRLRKLFCYSVLFGLVIDLCYRSNWTPFFALFWVWTTCVYWLPHRLNCKLYTWTGLLLVCRRRRNVQFGQSVIVDWNEEFLKCLQFEWGHKLILATCTRHSFAWWQWWKLYMRRPIIDEWNFQWKDKHFSSRWWVHG